MKTIIAGVMAVSFFAGGAAAYDVDVLQDAGDPANRFDLVLMGDGYRDVDQQKLTDDVNAYMNSFWQEPPYDAYRYFINVKLIHVISNENGADNGSYGAVRDTALDAYFNCGGIDRLLCINTGAALSIAMSDTPEYDMVFVIVNDPKYGGSGGFIPVFSVHSAANEVALHELGHSFGDLADEYETPYPEYPPCGADCPEPNATTKTVREEVKWNLWIDAATPVPTPETSTYQNAVGVFEGARYMSSGVYRPRQGCKMRSLGIPFGEVCVEAQVLAVYGYVSPIDSVAPAGPVALSACEDAELSVTYPVPDPDSMVVTWRVNGQFAATGPTSYTVTANDLGDGDHQVTAEVADTNALVLNDPMFLLVDEHTWDVQVTGSGLTPCLIAGECYFDGDLNPLNPCQECNPTQDPADWTNDDSNSCADDLFCNGQETCQAGACTAEDPCPDDGLDCTGACSEELDACDPLLPGSCLIDDACLADGQADPHNPCRSCQLATNPLDWTADDAADCQDDLFCNGQESCLAGECLPGSPPCTEDAYDCTETCNEEQETCNPLLPGYCLIDDQCYPDAEPDPQNPCRECQSAADPSGWTTDDSNPCGDDLFCNGPEGCQEGTCQPAAPPCLEDSLDCTVTCDEELDACNQLMTGSCLIDGACLAASDQNPDNPCLLCDPETDPAGWTASDQPCDDDDPCTENDTCQGGTCLGSTLCSDDCPCEEDGGSTDGGTSGGGVSGACNCGASGPSNVWVSLLFCLALLIGNRRLRRPN